MFVVFFWDALEVNLEFRKTFQSWFLFTDESLSIESPIHSEDFASTDLNFDIDETQSPIKEESVAIVNHGLIVSAKTETIERVVIPEKESKCCIIL